MKNINTLLEKLYSLKQSYMTKDLSKIKELCQFLYNPHLNYPIIHIAGTNGKGSVCSLLSSILQESGYKVGLYTSPHILKFNERIKINGRCIKDNEITKIYSLIDALATDISASFFDITTAIAFKHFSEKKVDVAIIETGLGGRLDSTNIVNPILSIITSISFDHTDILGTELRDIVKEKAGIIKKNVPAIIQDTNPHILETLIDYANVIEAPFFVNYNFPHLDFVGYKKNNIEHNYKMIYSIGNVEDITRFRTEEGFLFSESHFENVSYTKRCCPLLGKQQLNNIKLVAFACFFVGLSGLRIKIGSIPKGIENVIKNTGYDYRIKNVSKTERPIILDVAHNKDAINSLVSTLKDIYGTTKWNVIFGVMKDKDIEQILRQLKPICNKLILPELDIERAARPDIIKTKAKQIGFKDIAIKENVSAACDLIKLSESPSIICGTFHIMSDAVKSLNG